MREIKFRIWREEYKDMVYFDLFIAEKYAADGDIMQFTGLKDKSGREIYEGDMLRIYEHTFSPMNFIVEWSEVSLSWSFRSTIEIDNLPALFFNYSNLNGFESSCEEIGNIYQNPELLR